MKKSISIQGELNLFEILITAVLWYLYINNIIPIVFPIIGTVITAFNLVIAIISFILIVKDWRTAK